MAKKKDTGERKSTELRKKLLLEVLERHLGVITSACREAHIDRKTFYNWRQNDMDFAKEVDEIQDVALDFAESRLFKAMQQNNAYGVTAVIFYLKTKGKARGFIERHEIDGPEGKGIPIKVDDSHALEILETAVHSIRVRNGKN